MATFEQYERFFWISSNKRTNDWKRKKMGEKCNKNKTQVKIKTKNEQQAFKYLKNLENTVISNKNQ